MNHPTVLCNASHEIVMFLGGNNDFTLILLFLLLLLLPLFFSSFLLPNRQEMYCLPEEYFFLPLIHFFSISVDETQHKGNLQQGP